MAWYPRALRREIPPGSNDPRMRACLAILHIATSEGDSLYNWFNGPSGGIESHFYVRYNGVVDQYRDTDYEADANVKANSFRRTGDPTLWGAISIETEGLEAGVWTPEQLEAIKLLLNWIHQTHPDVPMRVPTAWNGSGVGYHILFMQEWAGGPRSCPGPKRIVQFNNIIVPWLKGTPVPLPSNEGGQIVSTISAANEQPNGYSEVVRSWFKDGNLVVKTAAGDVTPAPTPQDQTPTPTTPAPSTGGTVSGTVNAGECWIGLVGPNAVDSESMRRAQEALNATRFAPFKDIAVTGTFNAETGQALHDHQVFLGQTPDDPGVAFLGPKEAEALFAPFPQVTVRQGVPSKPQDTPAPAPAQDVPAAKPEKPKPEGIIYLSKLHSGQASSMSVTMALRALNLTSFPPFADLPISGSQDGDNWTSAVDDAAIAYQRFLGEEPDAKGSVSFGPKQSAKLFAPWAGQVTIIDDRTASQTQAPTPTPSTGGVFTRIVNNLGYIGTVFGKRGSSWSLGRTASQGGIHTGDDWPGPIGEPVLSTWTAKVVGIYTSGGWGSAYGTHVITERRDGIRESFCHLSSVTVGLGQEISPGTQVGRIGMTGNTTGPHCHHENRKGGFGFNLNDIIKPTY